MVILGVICTNQHGCSIFGIQNYLFTFIKWPKSVAWNLMVLGLSSFGCKWLHHASWAWEHRGCVSGPQMTFYPSAGLFQSLFWEGESSRPWLWISRCQAYSTDRDVWWEARHSASLQTAPSVQCHLYFSKKKLVWLTLELLFIIFPCACR